MQPSGKVRYEKSPDDGRDKGSAELSVLGEFVDVELLLWDSGEAEFNYGFPPNGTMEHHDLGSIVELEDLVDRFRELVIAGGGRATPGPRL